MHGGVPSVAIFLTDVTAKIRDAIKEKKKAEKEQCAIQAKKYTAMVSHSMLTPLSLIKFFVEQVGTYIKGLSNVNEKKKNTADGQIMLVIYHLVHLQSFVNDLLDIQ